jgi:hypothetical protein
MNNLGDRAAAGKAAIQRVKVPSHQLLDSGAQRWVQPGGLALFFTLFEYKKFFLEAKKVY